MHALNFPRFQFRMKEENGRNLIFDPVRKKYVALTPEEWVRQHLIAYLLMIKNVPLSLMGVEKQLLVNRMPKRFDVTVFSRQGRPLVLAECKAPTVELTEKVFDQIARYNLELQADYCIVTNGIATICCRMDYRNNAYVFIKEIPGFEEMIK